VSATSLNFLDLLVVWNLSQFCQMKLNRMLTDSARDFQSLECAFAVISFNLSSNSCYVVDEEEASVT